MIYFDNAATSFQKPQEVARTLYNTTLMHGANAGRGGHKLSVEAGEIINGTRALLCELFEIENMERLAFFPNATYAINAGIKGVMRPGSHAVTTSMEHNSVIRPLETLKRSGTCDYTQALANRQGELLINEIARAVRPSTKLIVMTHASNVCGNIYDIRSVYDYAKKNKIIFMVDASQSAGVFEINSDCADIIAFPGHKSLFGVQGSGGLYVRERIALSTIIEGGTGSMSEKLSQPDIMPDRLESGTQNVAAIAALGEGVRFIMREGMQNIRSYEMELSDYFIQGVLNIEGIKIYGTEQRDKRAGVVSLSLGDMDCNAVAQKLSDEYGIAVRGGLHCAPAAHKTLGTLETGTVRFSFGYFNNKQEIDKALNALLKISKNKNL